MFPLAVMCPVNKCVSSDELPNAVEPDEVFTILSDVIYEWAVKVPPIVRLST